MSMQTKTIGRMPTDHGPYDPQLAYGEKFTVTLFDCGWESKHDNNTTAPATLNAQTGTITPNIEHWIHRWGSYNQWLIDNGYKKVPASNIEDLALEKPQNEINAALVGEIGADSAPRTVKGRIKSLENSVGSGGSVDQRITQAKSEVIGGASSSGNTLKKVEDRVSPLEEAVGSGGSIDSRIESAKSELKGNATSACDTLGKAEAKINANASAISAEVTRAETAEADRYTKSETYTKEEVNGLVDTPHQEYVTVDAYASLPATGSKDTIYRVSNYNGTTSQVDASVYSEYAWNGSQYTLLCVKSQIGEVFDISVYNNNAKYADLADALGTNGEHVPQSLQKGGMSVKFVHTSDNKYVQYRLMSDTFNTTVTNWQGVDDKPIFGSNNVVKSEGVFVETHTFETKEGFNYYEFTDGKYISDNDGSLIDYGGAKYTDLIPVYKGMQIEASMSIICNMSCGIAFYTLNNNFVYSKSLCGEEGTSGSIVVVSKTIDIEEDGYIRIARQIDGSENDSISITTPVSIKENIENLKNDIDDVSDSLVRTYTYGGFNYYNFINGKYIDYNGSLIDYGGAKYTDYIPVTKGTIITASIAVVSSTTVAVAFYNNAKVFNLNKSIYTREGETGHVVIASGIINIEEDGYIRIARQIDGSTNDSISIVMPVSKFDNHSQWAGKKWYCFGTSLTDNDFPNLEDNNNPVGRYSNVLARLSGLIQYNHGVAGGRIATSEIYDPTAHIYNEIFGTDFSDADLITLEGFVNDVTASIPLGTIGSKDRTTLIGALSLCVEHFLNNSDALVVLFTSTFGKPYTVIGDTSPTDYGITYKNSIGLGIKDYNDAIKQVAEYYCIPCIETGEEAMINEFHPEFIIDQIHHSVEGGERFAQVVWGKLKNMSPLV